MKQQFLLLSLFVAVMLLTSGCMFSSREVTVSATNSARQQRNYYRNELFSQDGLTLEAENFLRGNLLQDDFSRQPKATLDKLNEFYEISGNKRYLSIAADLCRYLSSQARPEEAIRYSLSTYYYCCNFATAAMGDRETKKGKVSDRIFSMAQGVRNFNEACSGIFTYLNKRGLLDSDSVTLRDAEGRVYVMGKPVYKLSIPREAVKDFSLCSVYSIDGLRQVNRQAGLGVPLVARINTKEWYKSLRTPKGLTIPVTLLVKPTPLPSGKTMLQLVFVDTYQQENYSLSNVGFETEMWPLALDFSTPLACFLNNSEKRNLLLQMLNPYEQEESDGLYMLEPYQPNKIPVVFIHGLMSSPETWMQMINSLKNDATIRKRYQFWFFSYSTGTPVPFNASKLRKALLAAQEEFCTTHEAKANFEKMVLVGHSMGGLLTRSVLQKDPHYLAEKALETTWQEVQDKLGTEEFKKFDELCSTPPLPFVHRAVFMAVPHRGANMAQGTLARFGASIIKLPVSIVNELQLFMRLDELLKEKSDLDKYSDKMLTGLDSLKPDSPFILALGNSQMKDDLVYHCVVGNKDYDGAPGGSDGIVTYSSSHLDGAASELVVKSGHSVHKNPAAIQEVLRILLLHLKESSAPSKGHS